MPCGCSSHPGQLPSPRAPPCAAPPLLAAVTLQLTSTLVVGAHSSAAHGKDKQAASKVGKGVGMQWPGGISVAQTPLTRIHVHACGFLKT